MYIFLHLIKSDASVKQAYYAVRNSSQYTINLNGGTPISTYTSNEAGYTGIYTFIFRRGINNYILAAFDLLNLENANYKDFDCIVFYI